MLKKLIFFLTALLVGSILAKAQYTYLDDTEFDLTNKYCKIDVFQMYEYSDSFGYHIIGLNQRNIYYFDAKKSLSQNQLLNYTFGKDYCELADFRDGKVVFNPVFDDMSYSYYPMIIGNIDFNNDGFLDVIIKKDSRLYATLNNTKGIFLLPEQILLGRYLYFYYDFYVDSNNIIIIDKNQIRRIMFCINGKIETCKIPNATVRKSTFISVSKESNADIYNVLLMDTDSVLFLYELKSNKSTKVNLNITAETSKIKAIDLNNDNLPDLITLGKKDTYFMLNLGDNSFGEKQILYTDNSFFGNEKKSIICEDIDLDNDLDLILYDKYRMIFLNDGEGSFEMTYEDKRDYDDKGISLVDIDSDSDKDIILNSYLGLVLLENINGNFEKETIISKCRYFDFYFFTDINSDQKPDIIFKDQCSSELFWCKKTDSGFESPKNLLVPLSENK